MELQLVVSSAQGRYTVGLLFDISGEFDSVLWLRVLWNLKERDSLRNIYGLVQSNPAEKTAKIIEASEHSERDVTRDCPKGSDLGPLFWNLIFDEEIGIARQADNEPIAFADDLIVVVSQH